MQTRRLELQQNDSFFQKNVIIESLQLSQFHTPEFSLDFSDRHASARHYDNKMESPERKCFGRSRLVATELQFERNEPNGGVQVPCSLHGPQETTGRRKQHADLNMAALMPEDGRHFEQWSELTVRFIRNFFRSIRYPSCSSVDSVVQNGCQDVSETEFLIAVAAVVALS
jgi:hypothetical protein